MKKARIFLAPIMVGILALCVSGCAGLTPAQQQTDYTAVVTGTCLIVNTELAFLQLPTSPLSAADKATVASVSLKTVPICGTLQASLVPTNAQAALSDLSALLPQLANLYSTYKTPIAAAPIAASS